MKEFTVILTNMFNELINEIHNVNEKLIQITGCNKGSTIK